jgi:hypothetical protein
VPGARFAVTAGAPRAVAKTADSGRVVTSHFCGDCGSTLWRDGDSFGDFKVIKAGVMDDVAAVDAARPAVELFIARRAGWVPAVEGAEQREAML